MPTIDISDEQAEYLDDLRAELEDRHVGEYGVVRPRDALQFLIDRYESADAEEAAETPGEESATGESRDETEGENDGTDGEGSDEADDAEEGSDGTGRLQSMMQLLDEHEDKWEPVDSDQGKYAVTLPDGETEHVRTKDDVRALLFQHY